MSFAAFKALHQPTGVTECAAAFLTHNDDEEDEDDKLPDLVVVKGSLLEIYTIHTSEGTKAWLELAASFPLHGTVESLAVLPKQPDNERQKRDAIMLALRDAKVSVLEWDDDIRALRCSSMHCYEGEAHESLKGGRTQFPLPPVVRADPQGRCAAILLYDSHLLILRAQTAGALEDEDDAVGGISVCGAASIASSYLVNLKNLGVFNVKDFQFLHGYIEPVVTLLHESDPTWAGNLANRKNTCSLTTLSLNLSQQLQPVIWSAQELAYDARQLVAVPAPIGGTLALSSNVLYYYSQTSAFALALNENANWPVGPGDMPRSPMSVELDAAHATWLSPDSALLSLKTGALFVLSLVLNNRAVRNLDLTSAGASVLTSALCTITDSLLFLGSRVGNSMLVHFSNKTSDKHPEPPAKRQRLAEEEQEQEIAHDEELSLYQTDTLTTAAAHKYTFRITDHLVNHGPVRSFACTSVPSISGTDVMPSSTTPHRVEMVTCSGHGKNGSLVVLQRSVRPEVVTQVELPAINGMWAVHYNGAAMTDDSEAHAFLFISLASSTMVLETGEELSEVPETVEFWRQGPTLAVSSICDRSRLVQVYRTGLRLLDGPKLLQEIPATDFHGAAGAYLQQLGSRQVKDTVISSASIIDPYVLLRLSNGSIRLLRCENGEKLVAQDVPLDGDEAQSITACTLYHAEQGSWLSATTVGIVLAIAYQSGRMELRTIPSFDTFFRCAAFPSSVRILAHADVAAPSTPNLGEDTAKKETSAGTLSLSVVELCMAVFDHQGVVGRPYLLARLSDGGLLVYQMFTCEDSNGADQLRLERKPITYNRPDQAAAAGFAEQRMVAFHGINSTQGVLISGPNAVWAMVNRGRIHTFPQSDVAMTAFTPFHNVNCPHGFIYSTPEGQLQICQLPTVNFEADWTHRKIPLRCTARSIAHHLESQTYVVATSQKPNTRPPAPSPKPQSDDEEAPTVTTVSAEQEQFDIRVFTPDNWESVWQQPMEPAENVLTLQQVSIKDISIGTMVSLIAVGTAVVAGEDASCRGRLILLSVTRNNTSVDGGALSSKPDITVKQLFAHEFKGPLSALAALDGYLLLAIGPKIIVHTWNGTELTGAGFFDAPIYVTSISVVKNFVLLGDVKKSLYFLCWREDGRQLTLLSKDFEPLDILATDYIIDGSALSLVASTGGGNVSLFSYAPRSVESWKGQKLIPRGHFHIGSCVPAFARLKLAATAAAAKANRHAAFFVALDGSVNFFAPIDEITFRRLQELHLRLVFQINHVAGLNPQSYRAAALQGAANTPCNIVDGELLEQYEMLTTDEQLRIAHDIGTTRERILGNLRDLAVSTSLM
eukprot:jgi/Chlat1/6762/Chrsp50S06459